MLSAKLGSLGILCLRVRFRHRLEFRFRSPANRPLAPSRRNPAVPNEPSPIFGHSHHGGRGRTSEATGYGGGAHFPKGKKG